MKVALAFALCVMAAPVLACRVSAPNPHLGGTVDTETGQRVWYDLPSDIYAHGVLGDAIEGTRITLESPRSEHSCSTFYANAGDNHVFEDTAPRLVDLDGDGINEVIAVRSSLTKGAQLIVFQEPIGNSFTLSRVAQTPYIGRRNRWLAVVGAADLDGDGVMEIAYVDRPHLAKTLRIVQIKGDKLVEIAAVAGVTNHKIGERDIGGGIRECGTGPEMIVASADWSRVLAVTFDGTGFPTRDLGPYSGRSSFQAAMNCAL